ncbi:hypothetical protein [Nonomuraea typhae]|uniref:Uncharacterized protein n=1 Tax=Nonomuraea typhae TaxID=2603600 RepID=A0ABW7YMI7_9ACTN
MLEGGPALIDPEDLTGVRDNGRVNSFERLRYASLAIDADSADGTLLTNGTCRPS